MTTKTFAQQVLYRKSIINILYTIILIYFICSIILDTYNPLMWNMSAKIVSTVYILLSVVNNHLKFKQTMTLLDSSELKELFKEGNEPDSN